MMRIFQLKAPLTARWLLALGLAVSLVLWPLAAQAVRATDAYADGQNRWADSVQAQLDELRLHELERYRERVDPRYQEHIPRLNWSDISGDVVSTQSVGLLFSTVLETLFSEIRQNNHLLRQLVTITMLAALLHQLQPISNNQGITDASFALCFLTLAYVGLESFHTALAIANEALDDMITFMYALLPIMAALLAAVGGVTSAAIFHPVMLSLVTAIASLIHRLLLPVIFASAVLGIISHFSRDFPLSRLAGLARQAVVFLLGAFFLVFSGTIAIRGIVVPVADGLGLRTAKFLTRSLVPIAGGMFSDAVEMVMGGSLLIKNATGAFGLLMIFFLAAVPVLKLWAIILIYKLVAALIQPISDPRLVDMLGSLESSLTLVMVAVAAVALMFFLSITILAAFGNLAFFVR